MIYKASIKNEGAYVYNNKVLLVRAVIAHQLTGSVFDLAWFHFLSSEHIHIFDLHGAI